MENEIIEEFGQRWLVLEAKTKQDALHEIAHAAVTGSVGSKSTLTDIDGVTSVIAHVHKINSDGTLREPYTQAY